MIDAAGIPKSMSTETDIQTEKRTAAFDSMRWLGRVGLAYMQNMWSRDPQRMRDHITRYGEGYRVRMIEKLLFAGCVSGRRLRSAFGDELLRTIQWEEASREIAGDSKTICPPDPEHIRETLDAYKPSVVLTFGRVASDAVGAIWHGPIIRCCHPAARQPETIAKLNAAAREYSTLVKRPNAELTHPAAEIPQKSKLVN